MSMHKKVVELMANQPFPVLKNKEEKIQSSQILLDMGVKVDSEFYEFYSNYYGRNLRSNNEAISTMIDCSPPQKTMSSATFMAHDSWQIPQKYILFTSGEGESGYLYNKEDDTVWDFNLGDQELLGTNQLKHWNSFYEFLIWYLAVDEDEN